LLGRRARSESARTLACLKSLYSSFFAAGRAGSDDRVLRLLGLPRHAARAPPSKALSSRPKAAHARRAERASSSGLEGPTALQRLSTSEPLSCLRKPRALCAVRVQVPRVAGGVPARQRQRGRRERRQGRAPRRHPRRRPRHAGSARRPPPAARRSLRLNRARPRALCSPCSRGGPGDAAALRRRGCRATWWMGCTRVQRCTRRSKRSSPPSLPRPAPARTSRLLPEAPPAESRGSVGALLARWQSRRARGARAKRS